MKTALGLILAAVCAFGQLSGTVRDSASKLPVEGVKIVLSGPAAKTTQSSDTGDFRIEDAQPGSYTVSVTKQGYDPTNTTLEVKPAATSVTFEIKPWAQVEGAILGEEGRPLDGIPVYVGGLRDTTGKDGRYHAKDISGGRYTLSFQVPYELRRTTAVRDPKTGETFGYANTLFYPGVADRKLAESVIIAPGAHLTNFDVRLRRTRLVEMKGKVFGGFPETEVELDSAGDRPDQTFARRKLDERSGFDFDLLPPGAYSLVVYRNRPGDDLPYITTVTLGQAGLQDLEVPLPPFVQIEGIVRTVQDTHWEGPLRVTLGRLGYETEIRPDLDGRFTLKAIPPGEWVLMVDDNLLHRADDPKRKMYVIGPRRRNLRVTESGNPPLEIMLSDETGRISGMSDTPGLVGIKPAGDLLAFTRMVMPGKDGAFSAEVPPGDYRVALLSSIECNQQGVDVTVRGGAAATVHLKACQ